MGIQDLKDMVGALLAKRMPTPEMIREEIQRLRAVVPEVTDDEAERLALEFESIHGVTMEIGAKLEDSGFEKWLDDAKLRGEIGSYYWDRYRRFLTEKGFSAHVLATLDQVTDSTLGLLENPGKAGRWDRRGMVVGQVQSGKTANYTGLICKAADAGYRVIVVIAGTHNNLRRQTQTRLDEGFSGFDNARLWSNAPDSARVIGVGRYDSMRRPNAFTNAVRDFDKSTATSIGIPLENLREPALFVIKKNANTLKNLLEWLKEHNAKHNVSSIREPMLLIDDEADNASINIKKGRDEVSRINGQIREVLKSFDKSCYVGYTATPFANIFIDPDTDDDMIGADLFPKNFIVGLDPPDNYWGASQVFIDGPEQEFDGSIVRHIRDNGDLLPLNHKITHNVTALPESLCTAVRTFVVARAIRLVRGQTGAHNSMLVNASRFTNVQGQLRNEIHVLIDAIRRSIRVNAAKPISEALLDEEIRALHDVFAGEYEGISGVLWPEVQEKLLDSVNAITVITINNRSAGSLDYADHKTGLNVVAVGGFSLSRGLTLEGLIISYFLRNSMMYDTLMQMGRWFGYRPGYEDLCRVWMLQQAEGWYAHIAESIEELRDEFRRMEVANATPTEFGLKVRSHPDTLIVTARNKMGSGRRLTISVGLANRFIETTALYRDPASMECNRIAAVGLAEEIRKAGLVFENTAHGRLAREVPASAIMEFLLRFRNHPMSNLTDPTPVRRYIEERLDSETSEWDVLYPALAGGSDHSLVTRLLGFDIVCQRRSPGSQSDSTTLLISDRQRVASRGVEKCGLTQDQVSEAEERYLKKEGLSPSGKAPNFPDRIFREVRQKPLLIVHLLAIGKADEDFGNADPVVAWSISFPMSSRDETKVEYVVNTQWLAERYSPADDEDEMAGDED